MGYLVYKRDSYIIYLTLRAKEDILTKTGLYNIKTLVLALTKQSKRGLLIKTPLVKKEKGQKGLA